MNKEEIDIELRKHKHIVFGFDHYTTLGAVRSLGEVGFSPIVILRDINGHPALVPNSKYVERIHIVKTAEDGYDVLMNEYSNDDKKPFIYSCDDFCESCLDEHYDELKDKFFFFDGGEKGIISHYMDKDSISKLSVECGCNIPKGEVLKRGELPKTLIYPVITKSIKSISGGWKDDVFICYSEEELLAAYKKIKSEELLIEEYIEKKNELCLDGFCVNHGKDVFIPFQTTYIRLANGKYGNYMTLEPLKNKEVYDQVCKILQKAQFNGIFSVEFLIDHNDNLYFLEVNFRNSTWSYAFTCGGVNMLYEWAMATLGGANYCLVNARKEPFTALAEVRDFKDFVLTGKVCIFKWLHDLYKADVLYYYNRKDRKPLVKLITDRLSRAIKQRLRIQGYRSK